MATYTSLHFHIVFGTRKREGLLSINWRHRLFQYLGGAVQQLEGIPEEIGGMADHVHLLIGLRSTHAVADVVREVKKASSAWVSEAIGLKVFNWQEGYAAFTVSPSMRGRVRNYIANQEAHHRAASSQSELMTLLKKAGVKYDPSFLE